MSKKSQRAEELEEMIDKAVRNAYKELKGGELRRTNTVCSFSEACLFGCINNF